MKIGQRSVKELEARRVEVSREIRNLQILQMRLQPPGQLELLKIIERSARIEQKLLAKALVYQRALEAKKAPEIRFHTVSPIDVRFQG